MSCYFRHMSDVFAAAGIEITKENKKEIDRLVHQIVGIEYKDCSTTWKAVKQHVRADEEKRADFIARLREAAPHI